MERATLIVTAVTSFMGPFMISSVNVALPAIQNEFAVDAVTLSWIATAYLLATDVLLVPMGRIGDIYGRKKIFTWGLVVFTLSVFLSALVVSVEQLIAMRVLQGCGGAMVVTTGMAILTSVFPPQRRGKAIGIYVAAVYIGLSMGPFVGGILTQHAGWRSIFWAVLPIGLLSIWITTRHLKGEWAEARGERLDIPGSLLYGIALVLITYGSTLLPNHTAYILVVIGTSGLIVFLCWEYRLASPVFNVRLFTQSKLFTFSSLAALINYSATYAVTFLLSLYLQYIKGLPPQTAGMVLVAQPVCMALCSPLSGRLSDKIEPRVLASTGMALTAAGLVMLRYIGPDTPVPAVIGMLIVLGTGFGLFSSPNMNAIMGAVQQKYYGIASGTVATMRLLGQMTSMAIATVVFAFFIGDQQIVPDIYPLLLKCLSLCFTISFVMCLMGVGFSLFRGDLRQS